MAILTGPEIKSQVERGRIEVSPFDESRVQPNSLDLTLGDEVCVYEGVVYAPKLTVAGASSLEWSYSLHADPHGHLDSRKDNPVARFKLDKMGWLIKPGILYLMHVVEELRAPKLVMELAGKSSLARLGVSVHATAGHAETGFSGQYTMEVSATHPVIVYPKMAIAQVKFFTVEGEVEDYCDRGNYVGTAAKGAQPSRSWKQFER